MARAVAAAHEALDQVIETPLGSLVGADLLTAQESASRLSARAAELEARLLQQVETSEGIGARVRRPPWRSP